MEIPAGTKPGLGDECIELPDGRQLVVLPEMQDLHGWAFGEVDQPNERDVATSRRRASSIASTAMDSVAACGSSIIWRQRGVGLDSSFETSSTVRPGSTGQVTSSKDRTGSPRRTRSNMLRTMSPTVRSRVVASRKSAAPRGPAPLIASRRRSGTTTNRGRCVDACRSSNGELDLYARNVRQAYRDSWSSSTTGSPTGHANSASRSAICPTREPRQPANPPDPPRAPGR